ncbi:Trm112 family protein [Melittangium boletus]|uniref:Trm112 family protein n=1 Tax=Melittangium boletus TaxID=83453 RepID=UPI000BB33BA7|nr:Trm112 family protein [Melittangium boletus]
MRLPEWVLKTLACPECNGPLTEPGSLEERPAGEELRCRGCGLAYPVRDGVPQLLSEEARRPSGR